MKIKLILATLLLSLSSFSAIAGSGHDHGHGHSQPVSAEVAQKNAETLRDMMIKKEVLEESWKTIEANLAEKKTVNGTSEWLVTFVNEKSKDPEKKTLYVFLTMSGEYVAANFTGK